jgi:hypothetical protein
LNNQILINKKCYAQLYTKLITADIEREKNNMHFIDIRIGEWREYALEYEINKLEYVFCNFFTSDKQLFKTLVLKRH